MRQLPPKLFLRFFQWYCHPRLRDHIEGDLIEVYNQKIAALGESRAKVKFALDVVLLCRPGIIKPMGRFKNSNVLSMYSSYFKTGWRNLLRNSAHSSINVGGLAIGMTVAMLIGLWVNDELQFNRYNSHYDRVGRVLRTGVFNKETFVNAWLPYAVSDEMRTKYGDSFKNIVTVWPVNSHIVSDGDNKFSFVGTFMEPNGPELFDLKMLDGPLTGLSDPHSIFISKSIASTMFGDVNPIGRLLKLDNQMDVKVTGVYEDFPYNTHYYGLGFIAPFELIVTINQWIKYQGFGNNFVDIYAEISDNTTFEQASDQIKNTILNNVQNDKGYMEIRPQLFLHPMSKWHLYNDWKKGVNTGPIELVWLFGIVGVFVLLLACINFMNLSTARSVKRAKEVGVRKVIGSARSQLMAQFFSESFLVVILSYVIAFAIVSVSLNWFNELSGKQMQLPLTNTYFWLSSLAFIFFTGVIAGSYPALYLSSFKAVSVLKGALRTGRAAVIPRKVLVVIQFTVSVTLIIGTVIVYKQIQFAKDRPIGYNREGLLMIQMNVPEFAAKFEALRTELKNTDVVTEVAKCSSPPTDIWNTNGGFDWKGKDPDYVSEFATYTISPEYGKTIGWEFVSGRDLSRDLASDSMSFIINETTAKILGFENPVGETIKYSSWWTNGSREFTIVGVVKDMVVRSPFSNAMPAVFFLGGNYYSWITVRIDPNKSAAEALPKIEAVFKKVIPTAPFDYKFTDQEYALKFAAEERIGVLASVFAVLAILISCLGLFGLASFVAEQRTKEIGIRKVVGASVFSLWKMLSKDFVILVIVSSLIAVPMAAYLLSQWLSKYEYRTDLSWWIFAASIVGALVITLATVSYQAIKAALMKPVKSLRSE